VIGRCLWTVPFPIYTGTKVALQLWTGGVLPEVVVSSDSLPWIEGRSGSYLYPRPRLQGIVQMWSVAWTGIRGR
jgi:hypothetical protein